MARRFARPSREDYLVCTRGFPPTRWHELRRHVVHSAVQWGIWMGPELAQVAVSEGFARSRRDLIVRGLDAGFDALRRHPSAFDIDDDAAADNLKALARRGRRRFLGVELKKSVLGRRWPHRQRRRRRGRRVDRAHADRLAVPKGMSVEELMLLLEDRARRVAAALELWRARRMRARRRR